MVFCRLETNVEAEERVLGVPGILNLDNEAFTFIKTQGNDQNLALLTFNVTGETQPLDIPPGLSDVYCAVRAVDDVCRNLKAIYLQGHGLSIR